MPVYDYRCQDCNKVSEIFLRSSDSEVRCPGCRSENMERLISASYMIKMGASSSGVTCCGRRERCDKPPCSDAESYRRT
jgi:putative FmdB family regulatory protein